MIESYGGDIVYRKSKNVDFVFVYEVKNREIQGISLIGYELVKRGYKVGYVNTWHALHHDDVRYNARVAIVFEAYNTKVINFALSYIEHCDCVFNMQWEELLSDISLKEGSIYLLEGMASRVHHASWGMANTRHLIEKCKIPCNKVYTTGHVGFDFLRSEFAGFYKSKEDICREHSLNSNADLLLFISSFSGINGREEDFAKVMTYSQTIILGWLVKYAEEHPMTEVIYRPHPTEVPTKDFLESINRNKNIHIIGDLSIQQWIKISDVILNWWSTSAGELYVAKRPWVLLRPCEIPVRYDYHIFKGAVSAKTYEEMISQIEAKSVPITEEHMNDFYFVDDKEATYLKIVNVLEKLYKVGADYEYDNSKKIALKNRKGIIEARELYGYIKAFIKNKNGNGEPYAEIKYHFDMSKSFYVSERDIIKIMKKIGEFV